MESSSEVKVAKVIPTNEVDGQILASEFYLSSSEEKKKRGKLKTPHVDCSTEDLETNMKVYKRHKGTIKADVEGNTRFFLFIYLLNFDYYFLFNYSYSGKSKSEMTQTFCSLCFILCVEIYQKQRSAKRLLVVNSVISTWPLNLLFWNLKRRRGT